jgi:hypothetical protein
MEGSMKRILASKGSGGSYDLIVIEKQVQCLIKIFKGFIAGISKTGDINSKALGYVIVAFLPNHIL